MRRLAPVITLALLVVSAPAGAQTGELYWQPARHRFETEQGFAEHRPLDLGRDECPAVGPPCEELEARGSSFYYLAQYGARIRAYEDASLDPEGLLSVEVQVAWRVGASDDVATFGSLLVGGSVAWITRPFVMRAGLGLGAPIHELLDHGLVDPSTPLLLAPYGHGEAWLGQPTLPVVLELSFEGRHEWFFGGAELAGAVGLHPYDEHVMTQAAAFVGARPIDEVALGVRVLAAFEHLRWPGLIRSVIEDGYVSLTTFARLDTRPFFAELRWLINLDEPYGAGIGRTPLSIWSLRALLGWETD